MCGAQRDTQHITYIYYRKCGIPDVKCDSDCCKFCVQVYSHKYVYIFYFYVYYTYVVML